DDHLRVHAEDAAGVASRGASRRHRSPAVDQARDRAVLHRPARALLRDHGHSVADQHELQHARGAHRLHARRCRARVSAGASRLSGARTVPGRASRTRRTGMRLLTACFVVSLVLVNPYLRGDGNGYYAWLRSPLIDGDVDFGNEYLHADPLFRSAFVDETGAPTPAMRTPTGKVENQWSIGPALLWAPAFGVAHLAARAGVAPADGLSPPYLWLTAMSTAIYGFIAVLLGIDLSRRFGFQGTSVLAGAAVLFASSL